MPTTELTRRSGLGEPERLHRKALGNLELRHQAAFTIIGSAHRPLGSVGCGAFPVEPRTHTGEDLGHITHQIIVDLSGVDHDQLAALHSERGFDILRSEPAETIRCFTTIRLTVGSRSNARNLRRCRSSGPDLGHHLVHRDLIRRRPRSYPRHLPIQIGLLIRRRDPRIHRRPPMLDWLGGRIPSPGSADPLAPEQATGPRETSVKPATRGDPRATPLRSAHATQDSYACSWQRTTDNYRPLTTTADNPFTQQAVTELSGAHQGQARRNHHRRAARINWLDVIDPDHQPVVVIFPMPTIRAGIADRADARCAPAATDPGGGIGCIV